MFDVAHENGKVQALAVDEPLRVDPLVNPRPAPRSNAPPPR